MTIPEKGRKGLRVKLGDKLQYEVEEYRATGRLQLDHGWNCDQSMTGGHGKCMNLSAAQIRNE